MKFFFRNKINKDAGPGILLIAVTFLALITANSALATYYNLLIELPFEIKLGSFGISKPILLWINDGLMAIFFFTLGLELKRELIEGELSNISALSLPAFAAIGGMVIPALLYIVFNYGDPVAIKGWAIPAATDIAFALGILALIGKGIPPSLKVFLISLAIIDDIGAILVIAFFYTSNISLESLLLAVACIFLLTILNRTNTYKVAPYLFVGFIMWIAVLKSGIHATLAGVILAFFIPLKTSSKSNFSPAKSLEKDLHGFVVLFVIPLFAFVNAGVDLQGFSVDDLLHPVTIGIIMGLVMGKQIGVFLFAYIAVKLKLAKLPEDLSWPLIYAVSLICGIGFTMSLFIGSLAFEETGVNLLFDERVGILIGSFISGVAGYFLLSYLLKAKRLKISRSI